jgi:hypothetical protein
MNVTMKNTKAEIFAALVEAQAASEPKPVREVPEFIVTHASNKAINRPACAHARTRFGISLTIEELALVRADVRDGHSIEVAVACIAAGR